MCGMRSVVSMMLALVLVAGATIHGARAAGMAMPMPILMTLTADAVQSCDLCGGDGAEAAAQCALACAGLAGVVDDAMPVHADPDIRLTAIVPAASAGRFAGPDPDPPR